MTLASNCGHLHYSNSATSGVISPPILMKFSPPPLFFKSHQTLYLHPLWGTNWSDLCPHFCWVLCICHLFDHLLSLNLLPLLHWNLINLVPAPSPPSVLKIRQNKNLHKKAWGLKEMVHCIGARAWGCRPVLEMWWT